MMARDIEQPDLWTVPAPPRRRVFASTSRAAATETPDEVRATQRRKILRALGEHGALTYHQIAERTGISLSVVCWRMRDLDARGDGSVQFATYPDGSIQKMQNRRLVELAPGPRVN